MFCKFNFKCPKILISVKEDALAGTVVVQLAVTDLDVELVSSVEYYITAGDLHSQFAVRATGQVYVCLLYTSRCV